MDLAKTRAFLLYMADKSGLHADGKEAVGAIAELDRAEEVLKTATQWKADARAELRDTFAAAALTGLLTDEPKSGVRQITAVAYEYADAMLAAREGK